MSGALNAAAMPPAAPQPTSRRRSLRRSRRPAAEIRGERGADLGVARLEPDRGARAGRGQRLHPDPGTVAERHAATVEGVGLDRVDRGMAATALEQPQEPADHEAAERRDQEDAPGGDLGAGAEPGRGRQREEEDVEELRRQAQGRDDEPGRDADDRREYHERQFLAADTGPQPGEVRLERRRQAYPRLRPWLHALPHRRSSRIGPAVPPGDAGAGSTGCRVAVMAPPP